MTSTDLPRVKLLEFQVRTTLDFYQNQVKLSRCLIYKVQSAVFEDFSELFEALYRSRWQLIYYIRFISVCQELFSFLFKLFRPAPPLTEAAYLVYQTEKRLSRSFFISCRTFPVRPPLTEAAWLVYYPIRLLSTPFSIFFAFSLNLHILHLNSHLFRGIIHPLSAVATRCLSSCCLVASAITFSRIGGFYA